MLKVVEIDSFIQAGNLKLECISKSGRRKKRLTIESASDNQLLEQLNHEELAALLLDTSSQEVLYSSQKLVIEKLRSQTINVYVNNVEYTALLRSCLVVSKFSNACKLTHQSLVTLPSLNEPDVIDALNIVNKLTDSDEISDRGIIANINCHEIYVPNYYRQSVDLRDIDDTNHAMKLILSTLLRDINVDNDDISNYDLSASIVELLKNTYNCSDSVIKQYIRLCSGDFYYACINDCIHYRDETKDGLSSLSYMAKGYNYDLADYAMDSYKRLFKYEHIKRLVSNDYFKFVVDRAGQYHNVDLQDITNETDEVVVDVINEMYYAITSNVSALTDEQYENIDANRLINDSSISLLTQCGSVISESTDINKLLESQLMGGVQLLLSDAICSVYD